MAYEMVPKKPSDGIVLLTGATGHLGSKILVDLLYGGYEVKATVRSRAQVSLLEEMIKNLEPAPRRKAVTFPIVPDMTVTGAYMEAAEHATFVIHCASPQAWAREGLKESGARMDHFVTPAIRGTVNILDAAERAGTVERVVMTSSLGALVPFNELASKDPRPAPLVSAHHRIPRNLGPYGNDFEAYAASKVEALNAAEDWMSRGKHRFDAVYLHPGFLLGRNMAAKTAQRAVRGSNSLIISLLSGMDHGLHAGVTVFVDDLSRAHIDSLNRTVEGNSSYIVAQPAIWEEAVDEIDRLFPGKFTSYSPKPASVRMPTREMPLDMDPTNAAFRISWATFRFQVLDVVIQYLDLSRVDESETRLRETVRMKMRQRLSEMALAGKLDHLDHLA